MSSVQCALCDDHLTEDPNGLAVVAASLRPAAAGRSHCVCSAGGPARPSSTRLATGWP